MKTTVQYGKDARIALDLGPDVLVGECARPAGRPLDDPVQAVRAALASPLDFPPLSSMVLPDDRVVLALEEGVSCAPELTGGTVLALLDAGATPECVTILRSRSDRAIGNRRLLRAVPEPVRERLQIVVHDPADPGRLSYLAASKDDQPIYVARELCDADVVLPVGALHSQDRVGWLGVHHGWFPALADTTTQRRFHRSQSSLSRKQVAKRREECEEAAWLLGIQMMVQLVPAGNDRAMHVLAGDPTSVGRHGRELAEGAWQVNVDRRASLVVAAIGGGPEQQTWRNVSRTLATAMEAVKENGSIAICSQLKTKPGPALRRLAVAESREAADRAIRRQPTSDALPAARLNQALGRARVYLLSDLEEDDVESLGMAYVADPREIAVLASRHDSCLVLSNAQHVSLMLATEAAAG